MRRRRLVLIILSALLPAVLLLMAEGVARVGGWGGYPPVFRQLGGDEERAWFSTLGAGVESYFDLRSSSTGTMDLVHFADPKADDTVRIVLLGGSAMQGYPQPRALSNGAFLQAMLEQLWDDRAVEVLNFSATAVASYPVKCFLASVLDHDPDLVIVMTGNNEYYGAYGVASLRGPARSPTGMRMARWTRSLGLVQWWQSGPAPQRGAESTGPLMERMAAGLVGPHDSRRDAAARSLRAHLQEMEARCAERDVPLMLCTLPANERDMAPIGDLAATLESSESASELRNDLADALDRSKEESVSATSAWHELAEKHPDEAIVHYRLAQMLEASGDRDGAIAEYSRARDLDTMPWRASSTLNQVVRETTTDGDAVLCDMDAAFRQVSPQGAAGWELMDDHVHMSLAGQALFARTIVEAMARLPGRLHVDPEKVAALPDWRVFAEQLGANDVEAYGVARRMRTLLQISFMQSNNEEAVKRAEAKCAELFARLSAADREAVEAWTDPKLKRIKLRPLSGVAGYYRVLEGDYAGAAPLFSFARRCTARITPWRLEYTWYELLCSRHLHAQPTAADAALVEEGVRIGTLLEEFGGMTELDTAGYLGMILALSGQDEKATRYLERAVDGAEGMEGAEVVIALAGVYLRGGQRPEAIRLLRRAASDPTMAAKAGAVLQQVDPEAASAGRTTP